MFDVSFYFICPQCGYENDQKSLIGFKESEEKSDQIRIENEQFMHQCFKCNHEFSSTDEDLKVKDNRSDKSFITNIENHHV